MALRRRNKVPETLLRLHRAQAFLSRAEKKFKRATIQLENWQKKVSELDKAHRRAVQGSLWEEDADVAFQQYPDTARSLFS